MGPAMTLFGFDQDASLPTKNGRIFGTMVSQASLAIGMFLMWRLGPLAVFGDGQGGQLAQPGRAAVRL